MDWANVLENAVPVFTICGVFFLWLRQDNKRLEDKLSWEISQLRDDMNKQNEQLRDDMTKRDEQLRDEMNARFDSMEGRLRGVETEQARVAGLLEGLALTGRLPEGESDLG